MGQLLHLKLLTLEALWLSVHVKYWYGAHMFHSHPFSELLSTHHITTYTLHKSIHRWTIWSLNNQALAIIYTDNNAAIVLHYRRL